MLTVQKYPFYYAREKKKTRTITIALDSDVGRGIVSNLDNQENRASVVYGIYAPQKRETGSRKEQGWHANRVSCFKQK